MTVIERAIESAKCRIYRVKANNGQSEMHQKKAEDQIELMNVTIEALEKQVAKKPIVKQKTTIGLSYECPTCGTEWLFSRPPKYCNTCGQRLG